MKRFDNNNREDDAMPLKMRMLILATKVKELEEEIREKEAEEEEEVEEGPVATILANMKRTISNADALR